MKSATMRLIELAERLTPSGEIGDGMVAQLHEAATLARLEQTRLRGAALALQENDPNEPIADNGMTVLDGVREIHRAVWPPPIAGFLRGAPVCPHSVRHPGQCDECNDVYGEIAHYGL